MLDDNTKVLVRRLPKCAFCDQPAHYDAASFGGRWGYFCEHHFFLYTPGKLGLGVGQQLIPVESNPNKDKK